jgi:hypothetical protein
MIDEDENSTQEHEQEGTEEVIEPPPTTEYVEKSDKNDYETRDKQ